MEIIKPLNKKISFTLFTIFAVVGYGVFVFAAPPGPGGYNPGETLDPECTPGQLVPEPCIVQLPSGGSVTADNGLTATGSNVQLGGTLLQNTVIDQDGFSLQSVFTDDATFAGVPINYSIENGTTRVIATTGQNMRIGMFTELELPDYALYAGIGFREADQGPSPIMYEETDGLYKSFFFGDQESWVSTYDPTSQTSGSLIARNNNASMNFNDALLGIERIFSVDANGLKFSWDNSSGSDYLFPNSRGTNGQVLTTDGNGQLSWTTASGGSSLPTQTGHAGEYLTTDGTNASWTTIAGGGILGIGTINSQTRSANGAVVSGSNLILQTGNGILPGLLVGETTSTNTKLGVSSGLGITGSTGSVFIGLNAGENAANVTDEVYIGHWAGWNAANSWSNNAIGRGAGLGINHVIAANFFGNQAGQNATYSGAANFFGNGTGDSADYAAFSTFIGSMAGANTYGAAHSIFIGTSAGFGDNLTNYLSSDSSVDPISYVDASILIGHKTSTGNFKNSIAIGAYATNTSENQFMIGSTVRPINEVVIKGSGTCSIVATGISCSSDERLKTNIADLESTTLSTIANIRTVRYNWNSNPTGNKTIGFLAQDLEQYYPELVRTDSDGFKMVNYAQMTPIIVEAIREMNLNITMLSDMSRSNIWRDNLITWLGNTANGINDIYAKVFHADRVQTRELCLDNVCVTKDQLQQILQNNQINTTPPVNVVTDPDPDPVIPDANPITPTDSDPASDDITNSDQNSDSIPVITDTPNEQPPL